MRLNKATMKKTISNIKIILFVLLLTHTNYAMAQIALKSSDLSLLVGNWQGKLVYVDYGSNKVVTIPANVTIAQISETNNFTFLNSFPDEKNVVWTDTMALAADGRSINNETIVALKRNKKRQLCFVTEQMGKDGNENKPAKIRLTYTFSKNSYSLQKEVLFLGTNKWIKRHEYTYIREN